MFIGLGLIMYLVKYAEYTNLAKKRTNELRIYRYKRLEKCIGFHHKNIFFVDFASIVKYYLFGFRFQTTKASNKLVNVKLLLALALALVRTLVNKAGPKKLSIMKRYLTYRLKRNINKLSKRFRFNSSIPVNFFFSKRWQ